MAGDSSMFIILMPLVCLIASAIFCYIGEQTKRFKTMIVLIGIALLIFYYFCMDYVFKNPNPVIFYGSTYGTFGYYCFMFWLGER